MTLLKPKLQRKTLILPILLIIFSSLMSPVSAKAQSNDFGNLANIKQNTTTKETTVAINIEETDVIQKNDDTTSLIDEQPQPDKTVNAVITAYTSTPDQTDDTPCITADGTNLCKRGTEDVLAANWLPMGTKVKIPSLYGDRVFEIHDRMNRRYGYGRMDIWLNTSKAEARKFGVKRVDVEIYYTPKISKEMAKR